MVWFSCEDCGDSIKKPKLNAHMNGCPASHLTCLDCNATFRRSEVQKHTQCVTEHEKYAQGVTKAPGYTGPIAENKAAGIASGDSNPLLLDGPPWRCRVCNISCTSKDTLIEHYGGAKHKRKAKAAQREAPEDQLEGANKPSQAGSANQKASSSGASIGDAQLSESRPLKRQRCNLRRDAPVPSNAMHAPADGQKVKSLAGSPTLITASKKVKWKKLASKQLMASGEMKLKSLLKKVLNAAEVPDSSEARGLLTKKLTASSRFEVQDGVIKLLDSL